MKKIFKKLFIICVVFIFSFLPVNAKENAKFIARINQEFSTGEIPKELEIAITNKTKITDNIIIPQRSIVTAEVLGVQKERRWHKSGFIVCKAKSYFNKDKKETMDLENEDIYLIARKYEKIKGKDAALTGTEIVLAQAAGIFIPGIDLAYYFTKGAIKKEDNLNWFKSGVHNAYENSIFWFWLKGKSIELDESETVSLKTISEKRAVRLKTQIENRKLKQTRKEKEKS